MKSPQNFGSAGVITRNSKIPWGVAISREKNQIGSEPFFHYPKLLHLIRSAIIGCFLAVLRLLGSIWVATIQKHGEWPIVFILIWEAIFKPPRSDLTSYISSLTRTPRLSLTPTNNLNLFTRKCHPIPIQVFLKPKPLSGWAEVPHCRMFHWLDFDRESDPWRLFSALFNHILSAPVQVQSYDFLFFVRIWASCKKGPFA